jgi:oligoribonuclease NrnB/cAMP/cGMP phosphodiesterase (DHH superfamily)
LDGAACAVLGLAAGLEPHFVYPDGALAYLQSIAKDQPVVLADVSVREDAYAAEAERVVALIDHHQSALGLSGMPRVHIDLSHAASTLLYQWLTTTGRLPPDPHWERLLAPVEDHDLWRPEHREGQDLNRLLHTLGWEWFRDKYRDGFVPLTAAERERLEAVVREEEAFVRRHLERAEHFTAGHHPMAVVVLDSEGAVNEVAHELLTAGAHAAILVKPDGRLSVRSTDALDAARLMEAGFQGGGHPRAAGGRLAEDARANAVEWITRRTREVIDQATPAGRGG